VIVLIFRWATSSSPETGPSPADTLGFRPKNVSQDMVDTIGNMFPDIPKDNIRYDLLRTGSVEMTTNKILERGFIEPPPQSYYTLYPRTPAPSQPNQTTSSSSSIPKPRNTLISRYNLQSRVSQQDQESTPTLIPDELDVGAGGGKAKWEDTPEKREASLRERKEKMILAARQRMLAAQKEKGKAKE